MWYHFLYMESQKQKTNKERKPHSIWIQRIDWWCRDGGYSRDGGVGEMGEECGKFLTDLG